MTKQKTIILCLIWASISTSLLIACNRDEDLTSTGEYKINFTPAKTNIELGAIRSNKDANILRSLSDFDAVIQYRQSPLSKLPANVLKEFRGGIVTREGVGIVGLKIAPIREVLSEDDFAEVMAMFGLDTKKGFWGLSQDPEVLAKMNLRGSRVATDYEGYKCITRATCLRDEAYICLTGC